MENPIKLQSVSFSAGTPGREIEILRDVSLDVAPARMVAIHGRSGSGKSTLLSIIAGLQQPRAGSVEVLGFPFHILSDEERTASRRGRIGFVYQDFQLLPSLNAWENAVLPLRLLARPVDDRAIARWFRDFGLAGREKHFPAQLSGGEQQRVSIMRALLFEPQIILADEPTGNLDQKTARDFTDILSAAAAEQGATVVVVTHDKGIIDASVQRLELF